MKLSVADIKPAFVQTKYKGYDAKAMNRDYKKYVKFYAKTHPLAEAEKMAKEMVEYYKHTYRVYA